MQVPLMISRRLREAVPELKRGEASKSTLEAVELALAWFEEYTSDPDAIGMRVIEASAAEPEPPSQMRNYLLDQRVTLYIGEARQRVGAWVRVLTQHPKEGITVQPDDMDHRDLWWKWADVFETETGLVVQVVEDDPTAPLQLEGGKADET